MWEASQDHYPHQTSFFCGCWGGRVQPWPAPGQAVSETVADPKESKVDRQLSVMLEIRTWLFQLRVQ